MSTKLILDSSVSADVVLAWAADEKLRPSANEPLTNSRRFLCCSREDAQATWLTRASASHPLLIVEGEDAESLAKSAVARFTVVGLSELLGRVAAAKTPVARVRAMFDAGILCELNPCEERAAAIEAVGAELSSDEPLVRYSAAEILCSTVDRRALELLAAATERHPDLAPARDGMQRVCQSQDDGTLHDGPTDSWWELEQRARAGVAAGQWKRVVKASEDLLAKDGDNVQGLYFRGLAHEAEGEILLALAFLGGARATLALELQVHDEHREADAADEKAEERTLLAEVEGRLEALREKARALSPEALAAAREALLEHLSRWWKKESTVAAGAARALLGVDPELEVACAFVCGAYHSERELLERVLTLAPGCLAVELRLARAIGKVDKGASSEAYERILARLRTGAPEPASDAARVVARFDESPGSLADVLESLAQVAHAQKDRKHAMELADELVRVNPDSITGWQLRGHARLFELMYAEAAEAYADAIREITRIRERGEDEGSIFFGEDPRAMLHMNRACAFGRLGMRAETLECLREAVRANNEYAEKAKTEDWIECVWGTPEFAAITRLEPRALATKEELGEEFVARLITRCKGRFYRREVQAALDAGERAAELAAIRGDVEQEVEALSALSYALTFSGAAGRAVELMAKAVVLAERASPERRAEALATRALALHTHGDLEGAERAYHEGMEARRRAWGEEAPVVAKSWGDLARLFGDRGRPEAEVRECTQRGIDHLSHYLEHHTEPSDDWSEAITDLGTLQANLAHSLAREARWPEAVAALESCTSTFTKAVPHSALPPSVLENARDLAIRIAGAAGVDAGRARELVQRLDELRFPGSPAARKERVFFGGLRRLVARMRAQGVEDAAIANALRQAAREPESLPPELRSVPELASLSSELAARAASYPTFIVMSGLAFELLPSDLDGGLQNLEELCVGYALEGQD